MHCTLDFIYNHVRTVVHTGYLCTFPPVVFVVVYREMLYSFVVVCSPSGSQSWYV